MHAERARPGGQRDDDAPDREQLAAPLARAHEDMSSGYSEDSFMAESHRRNSVSLTLGLPTQSTLMHYVEKRLDEQLGSFSEDRLPYRIKDGDELLEAESEYLLPCTRDYKAIGRLLGSRASHRAVRRYHVPYSSIRERDAFDAYAQAIQDGLIRRSG